MDLKKFKILLGSTSPRRKLLLEELGFNFRILASNTDEIPLPHLQRHDIALYLAEEKANVLTENLQENEILITADTIVWHNSHVLGKPSDEKEAEEILQMLNGKKHQVYTGVCILKKDKKKLFCVTSDVTFRKVTDADILKYIQTYKPFDKAGSYGAQECLPKGINPCSPEEMEFLKKHGKEDLCKRTISELNGNGIPLIEHIEGSYFNVMGLPIVQLVNSLESFA